MLFFVNIVAVEGDSVSTQQFMILIALLGHDHSKPHPRTIVLIVDRLVRDTSDILLLLYAGAFLQSTTTFSICRRKIEESKDAAAVLVKGIRHVSSKPIRIPAASANKRQVG